MKKIIAIVITLLSLYFVATWVLVSSTEVKSLIYKDFPPEITAVSPGHRKVIKNYQAITQFYSLIADRKVKKISASKGGQLVKDSQLSVEYGYKGNELYFTKRGQVLIRVYKSEIRNKSRVHWLWWKADSLFGDRRSGIYYMSEEDQSLIQDVKMVLRQ